MFGAPTQVKAPQDLVESYRVGPELYTRELYENVLYPQTHATQSTEQSRKALNSMHWSTQALKSMHSMLSHVYNRTSRIVRDGSL